jgi:hypothetical protein
MLQLVYASSAICPFSATDLTLILHRSRPRNELYGVTGMLLYHSGSFLQVLEGPQEGVDNVYRHILRDRRHTAATVLLRQEISRREFEGWSMGFADTSSILNRPDGFVDYHRVLPALSDAPTRACQYLRFFQQGLCRPSIRP